MPKKWSVYTIKSFTILDKTQYTRLYTDLYRCRTNTWSVWCYNPASSTRIIVFSTYDVIIFGSDMW